MDDGMLVLSDDYALEDLIGHASYRDGLIRVIRSVRSSGSFTIGVFGSWGSGKTSLLRQIKAGLEDASEESGQGLLTVWFNPWQFVAEEHLIIPFFHTLVSSLQEAVETEERRAADTPVKTFLRKLANVPAALLYGMEAEFKIPLLLQAKLNPGQVLDHQKEAARRIEAESSGGSQGLRPAALEYQSTYYNLIEVLQQAGADLDVTIVVFIDDLDRCLPEKAIEFLEGLKVLLDLPNFVFVLGAAREVIEQGIRARHGDSYSGSEARARLESEYLDKIIQFPFSLPAPDPEMLKENILRRQLEKVRGADRFVDLVHEALGDNPRTLKRFINSVSFTSHLAANRFENKEDVSLELLIKISLIGYLFPTLFRQLERYPSHLLRLQTAVREATDSDGDQGPRALEGGRKVSQTGLPIIDQWLSGERLERLYPILRDRVSGEGDSRVQFADEESVYRHVRLLGSSLDAEFESKPVAPAVPSTSLEDEMRSRLVEVPRGKLTLGTRDSLTTVAIERSFWIDKYEVTQALYEKVVGENPSAFLGEDLPVDSVSWFEAAEFCNALSRELALEPIYVFSGNEVEVNWEGSGYRLPTEAEWMYVHQLGGAGPEGDDVGQVAWFSKNSKRRTHGVGQKRPNELGVYDLLGNVWEWCNDWFSPDYLPNPERGIKGPETGESRVLRGGSWANFSSDLEGNPRSRKDPLDRQDNQGFRVVRLKNEGK